MQCRLCKNETKDVFSEKIMNKYDIKYYVCPHCGFMQTEDPFWLDEAYKKPITDQDTGLLQRNIKCAQTTKNLLNSFFDKQSKYVDWGGGYGIFVRLMRDNGYNFFWEDLYCDNLFAKGFEYKKGMNIQLITTFEAFEHFEDPIKEIENLLSISKNIFFTTELRPTNIPDKNWWYYGFDHGQHIALYTKQSLLFIAQKYKLNLYSNNHSFHLLTEKKLSAIKYKYSIKKFI